MIGSAVQHPPFLRSWQLMDTNPLPATINEWSPNFIRLVPCKVKQRHQKPQEIRPASWFPLFFFSDAGSHSFCRRARESPLVPCNYRLSSIPVTHTNCWPTGPFLVDQRRRLQILCGGKSPAATLMPCAHQQQTGHKWTYQICFEAQFDLT